LSSEKKVDMFKKNCHVIISCHRLSCCYLSSAVYYIGEATGFHLNLNFIEIISSSKIANPASYLLSQHLIYIHSFILFLHNQYYFHSKFVSGKFHDQGDAEWIVIRGQLRGHDDTPCRRPGLSAARGLAALRVYMVV
jgi:hypothetical protein